MQPRIGEVSSEALGEGRDETDDTKGSDEEKEFDAGGKPVEDEEQMTPSGRLRPSPCFLAPRHPGVALAHPYTRNAQRAP